MDQRTRRHERGFTLVELLVVIAIIVILSAVAVYAVGGITDRGGHAACEGSEDSLRTASQSYMAMEGEPAPSLHALIQSMLIEVDDDVSVSGNDLIVEGGTITYVPAFGRVVNTCA